jgi:hypothetical protein
VIQAVVSRKNKRYNSNLEYHIEYTDDHEYKETKRAEEEKRKLELIEKRNKLTPENYIKKFLQHAERNYRKVDKYGNQNKNSLEKEIAEYLVMIARQIGNKADINSAEAYAR